MMNEQRFETGKSPQVTVRTCAGALVVGSWKDTAVLAQGQQFTAETVEMDHIALSSDADLTLTVPEKASLTIEAVQGTLTVKHVDGRIAIGAIDGDITLNDVGRVAIEKAGGRLKGKNINGPITVSNARQPVNLRNVTDVGVKEAASSVVIQFANGAVLLEKALGQASLQTISGDVIVREAAEAILGNLGGKNEIGNVKGNIQLTGGLANGEHHFAAQGDILVAWPMDGPITLVAEGKIIDNQLSLAHAATTKLEDGRTQLTGHIEQGKPFVALKTTANIGLKPLRAGATGLAAADFDFTLPPPTLREVLATAVTNNFPNATPTQIQQITAAVEAHLKPPLPSPPSPGQVAAAQAQRKVEKSLQKAQKAIEQARTPSEMPEPEPEIVKSEATHQTKPTPETAVSPSQTQILTLLKNDLITVEQANTLLNQL